MKRRNGFVSNSSSSSFIVSSKKSIGKVKIEIEVEVDINNYVEETITNEKELKKYFKDQWCLTEDDFKNVNDKDYPEYNKMLDEIKKGRIVYCGSFGSCSTDPIETMLCTNGLNNIEFNKDVKIIESEGGY